MTQGATNATFTMKELKYGDTIKIGGTEYHISATVSEQQKAVGSVKTGQQVTIDGITYTVSSVTNNDKLELKMDDLKKLVDANGKSTVIANGKTYYGESAGVTTATSATNAYNMIKTELALASGIGADASTPATVKSFANKTDADGTKRVEFSIDKAKVESRNDLNFGLHVGADADMTNKISVKISSLDTKGLGIQGLNVMDAKGAAATYAIDAIADAVSKVSAQRSLLGAVQNRLEHTINNLDNVVENTTSAESQIRDTDMATEMVKYSNANILSQAGQSMLSQANQGNQGVLALLG